MTVYEAAKRHDPDGNVAKIAEVLTKKDTLFKDIHAKQSNDTHSHVTTIRLDEGEATPRHINDGADEIESRTDQVRDEIMLLDNFLVLDEQIVNREGDNAQEFRAGELKGILPAYINGFHRNVWYGGGARLGEIRGLSNRFNLSTMDNVTLAGGSGNDCSSLWAIEGGDDGENVHLIYPGGANGCGINEEDLGRIPWEGKNNKKRMSYVNHLTMQFGYAVRNEMAIQRLANIESDFSAAANNLRDEAVIDQLIYMLTMLPEAGNGAVIYCNRQMKAQIDQMAFHRYGGFHYEMLGGKRIAYFMECPVRMQDSLLPTESAIA